MPSDETDSYMIECMRQEMEAGRSHQHDQVSYLALQKPQSLNYSRDFNENLS